MGIPEMNAQTGRLLEDTCWLIIADMHITHFMGSRGHICNEVDVWLIEAMDMLYAIRDCYYKWDEKHMYEFNEWEGAFAWQHVYGTLESVCAQSKSRKRWHRERLRNDITGTIQSY